EILSNYNQVDLINLAESKGEPLRLIENDRYYIGMLDDVVDWSRFLLRRLSKSETLYTAKIQLNISEEGSV
ncbi:MAG: hypothetical protein ABFC28_01550, partial [Rikenellaceae bacterium]